MTAAVDISGQRFGRLTVLHRAENGPRWRARWVMKCDCGNERNISLESLRTGTKSCGCLCKETTRARSLTHGHQVGRTASRTLKSYSGAKSRCTNPNDEKYPNYGGRGIKMCAEWKESFEQFLADMGECPPGLTLDRVDVDGNYEPGNCRWTTAWQQSRNRTNSVFVTYLGRTMILKDYASTVGINYKSLHARLKYRGQSLEDATASLKRT